jgi:hypothetical protein
MLLASHCRHCAVFTNDHALHAQRPIRPFGHKGNYGGAGLKNTPVGQSVETIGTLFGIMICCSPPLYLTVTVRSGSLANEVDNRFGEGSRIIKHRKVAAIFQDFDLGLRQGLREGIE